LEPVGRVAGGKSLSPALGLDLYLYRVFRSLDERLYDVAMFADLLSTDPVILNQYMLRVEWSDHRRHVSLTV
jgi:hypothetical protein